MRLKWCAIGSLAGSALHFVASDVDVLLLKGAALAYTIYPQPRLRPADDIDLFIVREALERAELALATCGYERTSEPDAGLASSQRHYVRRVTGADVPVDDLHWRVANPRLCADAIGFDDAWAVSIPVLPLGSAPRSLGTCWRGA